MHGSARQERSLHSLNSDTSLQCNPHDQLWLIHNPKNLHFLALLQIGVIPARFQSVRYPGKPLVKILGVPMVVRTWQQACLCKTLSKVIVATDDERIAEACRQEGAEVIMTSVSCANGAARSSAEGMHGPDAQAAPYKPDLKATCLQQGLKGLGGTAWLIRPQSS